MGVFDPNIRTKARCSRAFRGGQFRAQPLIGVLVALIVLALPAGAGAASNYTWTGTGYKIVLLPNEKNPIEGPIEEKIGVDLWSAATNWQGEVAPSGSVGALVFPELTDPGCNPPSYTETSLPCYITEDDIPGLRANAMFVALGGYEILPGPVLEVKIYNLRGNQPLTLGEGGLTAAPQHAENPWTTASLELPVVLGAPQTWSISGNGEREGILEVNDTVTGESSPLEISLNNGVLADGSEIEAGPISIVGGGSINLGNARGPHYVGILNGKDGNPVTVGEGTKLLDENTNNFVNNKNSIGALTLSDFSTLRLGQPEFAGGVTLGVNGGVDLSPASKVALLYNSHLHATGPVELNSAQLVMEDGFSLIDGTPTCNVLDEDVLISTTGQLTGTFRGIPDGTIVPLSCEGLRTPPEVRINYTAHAATATLLQRTETELAVSNASPSPSEQVTYTATVIPQRHGEGLPTGSVEFRDGSQPIGDCSAQPLALGESDSTASCTLSYPTAGSHTISTAYLGNSDFASSSSSSQGVTVKPAAQQQKRKSSGKCKGKHGKAKTRCLRNAHHHRKAHHRKPQRQRR